VDTLTHGGCLKRQLRILARASGKENYMQNRKIIGIAGKARSGKDTIASILLENGYQRFGFADILKETIATMFGWDERHKNGELKDVVDPAWGFSPRRAFQLFGTEFGRGLDENLWITLANRKLGYGKWVVSDVRFENEAKFIRENGALIHVIRDDVVKVEEHSSEAGVFPEKEDYVIENNGSLQDLRKESKRVLSLIEPTGPTFRDPVKYHMTNDFKVSIWDMPYVYPNGKK